MPNAYTESIYKGERVFAADLAAGFARSLSFTIHQRDSELSAPPTHRKVGDYQKREIERLESERARLLSLSDEQIAGELDAERERIQKRNEQEVERHNAMRARYDEAIAVFESWPARTKSGKRVKQVGIEQLEESKRFDCGGSPFTRNVPPLHSRNEWHDERIESNLRDLERARKRMREEQERCDEVNQWVDDFYADIELLDGIELNVNE